MSGGTAYSVTGHSLSSFSAAVPLIGEGSKRGPTRASLRGALICGKGYLKSLGIQVLSIYILHVANKSYSLCIQA